MMKLAGILLPLLWSCAEGASHHLRRQQQRVLEENGGGCLSTAFFTTPTKTCLTGQAIMFSFRDCDWVCKQTSGSSSASPLRVLASATSDSAKAVMQTRRLCMFDPQTNPMPGPCTPGFAATFNFKDCEWQCQNLGGPGALAATVGGGGGTVTAPSIDSAEEPEALAAQRPNTIVVNPCGADNVASANPPLCAFGQAAVYNFRECEFQCKSLSSAGVPSQARSAAKVLDYYKNSTIPGGNATAVCTYDPIIDLLPAQGCLTDESSVFDFETCEWTCQEFESAAIESPNNGQTCPPGQYPALNEALNTYDCIVVPQLECSLVGEYAFYDPVLNVYNCA